MQLNAVKCSLCGRRYCLLASGNTHVIAEVVATNLYVIPFVSLFTQPTRSALFNSTLGNSTITHIEFVHYDYIHPTPCLLYFIFERCITICIQVHNNGADKLNQNIRIWFKKAGCHRKYQQTYINRPYVIFAIEPNIRTINYRTYIVAFAIYASYASMTSLWCRQMYVFE